MSTNIPPISKVAASSKAVTAPEPTVGQNQKAYLKALDNLSKHIDDGDLNAAKKAFVEAAQALKDVEKSKGALKGNTKDMKKTVDAIGTAFRANDIKEAKKGVEAAKKALEMAQTSQKVADDALVTKQKSDQTLRETGNQVGRLDTSRSMFNAIA
ncbi:MAG: hypothetical protein WCO60_16455 [Verrucomicrobiota bacterium]